MSTTDARGGEPSPPTPAEALVVRAALRAGASRAQWRELAARLGVQVVWRETGGVSAVLAPGLLILEG